MKKLYVLPNLFTTANMLFGFYAMISAIHGRYLTAAWCVFAAIAFDVMDGRIARMAKATSSFGVEYDSLSDMLSFGVAPAVLVYLWSLNRLSTIGWIASFLYVVCAALRLARFNVSSSSPTPKSYFQGLPSPVAAATLASSVIFFHEMRASFGLTPQKDRLLMVVTFFLGALMVSSVRFVSFKDRKIFQLKNPGFLVFLVLVLVLVAARPEIMLFVMSVGYIAFGMGSDLIRILFGKQLSPSGSSHAKQNSALF